MSWWKRWFGRAAAEATQEHARLCAVDLPASSWLADTTLPIPDWNAVAELAPTGAPDAAPSDFWRDAATGWLQRLAEALGPDYVVAGSEHFVVLSALSPRQRRATIDHAERTLRRILKTLPGIAAWQGSGPGVVVVFSDHADYYRYVDHYYPDEGVFAMSGGMFIDAGYGHFVFPAEHLGEAESVLVHELTHALLRHLDLPRWLDEGAAVNMERHLLPHRDAAGSQIYSAHEMAGKHAAFWNAQTIQEFWTGHSFLRPDDGNLLSYDLAERLTQLLSRDTLRYAVLLRAADAKDSGDAALREAFGLDAGAVAAHVLGPGPWEPRPSTWDAVEAHAVSRARELAAALPPTDDAEDSSR